MARACASLLGSIAMRNHRGGKNLAMRTALMVSIPRAGPNLKLWTISRPHVSGANKSVEGRVANVVGWRASFYLSDERQEAERLDSVRTLSVALVTMQPARSLQFFQAHRKERWVQASPGHGNQSNHWSRRVIQEPPPLSFPDDTVSICWSPLWRLGSKRNPCRAIPRVNTFDP